MNVACFVRFMTFHFFLNFIFHANICPIRTLIVIYFIFFSKKFQNVCQPASPDGTFSKQSLATYLFLILTFFAFLSAGVVIFFKYMIEKYFWNKL